MFGPYRPLVQSPVAYVSKLIRKIPHFLINWSRTDLFANENLLYFDDSQKITIQKIIRFLINWSRNDIFSNSTVLTFDNNQML